MVLILQASLIRGHSCCRRISLLKHVANYLESNYSASFIRSNKCISKLDRNMHVGTGTHISYRNNSTAKFIALLK